MGNKSKKKARKIGRRTAKLVEQVSRSVGPVLAGLAAGLAARDVTGSHKSYLENVSHDFTRLLRTIGSRAIATLEPSERTAETPSNGHSAPEPEHTS